MTLNKKIDIIVPISLGDPESAVSGIIEQNEKYGFTRFALIALSKGWRGTGYPPREHYIEAAERFKYVKEKLCNYNFKIGWYMALSVKSGHSEDFEPIIKENGDVHPFASCPMDSLFKTRLTEDISLFAKIAKPAFIFVEDDFSLSAANGCFCKKHLDEFAKRTGRYYSREELLDIFSKNTEESLDLMKKWNKLKKDTLVELAKVLRFELDKHSPEIPVGCMQSGASDNDGNSAEAISKALAGPNHIPFSRLYGTFYCGVNTKEIPEALYHALYSKEHINGEFRFYQEADAYPHTRFYTAGKHMKTMMSTMFSYGFDGAIFFTRQGLDDANEDPVYSEMFAGERNRFNAVYNICKQTELKGIEINYDTFYNSIDKTTQTKSPLWLKCISRFGISYTSVDSDVAFWDLRQAKYFDDDTVLKYLSKGLFLDGDAAKILCQRGFGKYLGVDVGEDVASNTKLIFDLGAKEIIEDKFVPSGKGKLMPPAHAYAPPGNGKWLKLNITDNKCEIVSGAYTTFDKLITPTMTRFENELGGKIVVMSLTLDGNNSQALFNYRRQRLIQNLISRCSDKYVYATENPDIFLIMNEAKDTSDDFIGMLTVINLNEDDLGKLEFHLPSHWKNAEKFRILNANGEWKEALFEKTNDGVIIINNFDFCEPVYIMAVK